MQPPDLAMMKKYQQRSGCMWDKQAHKTTDQQNTIEMPNVLVIGSINSALELPISRRSQRCSSPNLLDLTPKMTTKTKTK
jgi:hypothetical protein